MPLVSIIVPVYNAEQTIRRCVNSILSQSVNDFELILINDGSKDSSGTICDDYCKKDHRVRVFHKNNGGVSSARNIGIAKATGDYVTFVDSDDWVDKDYLLNMLNSSENQIDLVCSGVKTEHVDGTTVIEHLEDSTITNQTIGEFIMHQGLVSYTVWSKLFRNSMLSGLRFNETLHYNEDCIFLYEYILQTETIRFIPKEDYHYSWMIEDSLSRRQLNSLDSELACLNQSLAIAEDLVVEKNITDNKVLEYIQYNFDVRLSERILKGLYTSESISKTERIATLRALNSESYYRYAHARLSKRLLFRYCSMWKMIRLYDSIMHVYRKYRT